MIEMLETLAEYFSLKYVISALIVGVLISVCSSLLGVSLVLKRCSMIGDGLSHVAFGALALASVLGFAPLAFSVPIVVIAAVVLLRISENAKIGGDAAIAMISSASLALGVIFVSLSGMNTDITSYMFGSLVALEMADVVISVILSVFVLIFYVLFFKRIFAVTFDENFAKASGISTEAYKIAIAVITAITIAVGMRVIGAMLISALVIFPALTSMRVFGSFRGVAISSVAVSVVCAFVGIAVSCLFSLPAGASIVVSNVAAFCIFSVIGFFKRRLNKG